VILLTTSLRPTRRVRSFCNDIQRVLPNVIRVTRGKLALDALAEKALELNANGVVVVERWKGEPSKITFYRVTSKGLETFFPILFLANVKLQRDYGQIYKPVGKIAVSCSSALSEDARRVAESFSEFFRLPILESNANFRKIDATLNFSSQFGCVVKVSLTHPPVVREVGPSFTVKTVKWNP
jgi:rRNA maturation protein Rpf1